MLFSVIPTTRFFFVSEGLTSFQEIQSAYSKLCRTGERVYERKNNMGNIEIKYRKRKWIIINYKKFNTGFGLAYSHKKFSHPKVATIKSKRMFCCNIKQKQKGNFLLILISWNKKFFVFQSCDLHLFNIICQPMLSSIILVLFEISSCLFFHVYGMTEKFGNQLKNLMISGRISFWKVCWLGRCILRHVNLCRLLNAKSCVFACTWFQVN